MKSARYVAVAALIKVTQKQAYSSIEFKNAANGLQKQEAAFASTLFYGVLERKITLDYIIDRFVKKGAASLDSEVCNILRAGLYQLLYMNAVDDYAAVSESVKLAPEFKKTSAKGLINGVLRNFIREKKQIKLPDEKNAARCVEYSCPLWIIELLTEQYGEEFTDSYLSECLLPPPVYIRVNPLKTNPDELIARLAKNGVIAQKTALDEYCLILKNSGNMEHLQEFKAGLFHVQDAASQLCLKAAAPKKGNCFLDLCAAPGSKSFTAAEYMQNDGEVYSFDLLKHKLDLIEHGAKRLGIDIIKTGINDATVLKEELFNKADVVLCDVPCSGLGIFRRKPDIKYKNQATVQDLPAIQFQILKTASNYVKPGGKLIYSTCTLNKNENEKVVCRFLAENNSFKPLQLPENFDTIERVDSNSITLTPQRNQTDGFYFAMLQKSE